MSCGQTDSDSNLQVKIRRIRERYGPVESASIGSSSSASGVAALTTEKIAGAGVAAKSDHEAEEVVQRLERTMLQLQQRNAARSDAQGHLEQLIAAMHRTPRHVAAASAIAAHPVPSSSSSSVNVQQGHEELRKSQFFVLPSSSSPLRLQPRRDLSLCRPAKLAVHLSLPLLLRFPILFPSVDSIVVKVVFTLDALMESAGDDVALKLLEQVADHLVEPSLKSAQEMDSSAAFVSISLRGVREVLLRLRHASVAKDNFSVVFPSRQRSSCIASVASSVEGAPECILIEGPSPLYEDERLRSWSQRLWALLSCDEATMMAAVVWTRGLL